MNKKSVKRYPSMAVVCIIFPVSIIMITVMGMFSLRSQLDRERTAWAARECEILDFANRESLKTLDDLFMNNYLLDMKSRGISESAMILYNDRSIRASTDMSAMGRIYEGPCVEEAGKTAPGDGPVICAHRVQGSGERVRVFAKKLSNPITGEPMGVALVPFPEKWFTEGAFMAAVPGFVAGGVLLVLGLVAFRYWRSEPEKGERA